MKNTLPPEMIDMSPFTGDPCSPPCWYGLRIAESNETEVVSTLKSLEFIDQESLKIDSTSIPDFDYFISANLVTGKRITTNCLEPRTLCLILNIANGKLRDIRSILNYEISFSEVIKSIGNPDKIGYTICCAESMACEIQLIWIKKQLVLTSETFAGIKGCDYSKKALSTGMVDADLEIMEVDILPVEDINHLVDDSELFGNFSGVNP